MSEVLTAVIPVFGIIWLGYIFKKINMPGEAFWPLAERITYFVFLPSLFFLSILKADFGLLDNVKELIFAVLLTTCGTSLIVFLAQYGWLKMDGKRFASFYQGGIRFNNYVGIPIIFSLYGHEGLVIYAIIIGISIPLTNIFTVAVMTHYASDKEFKVIGLLNSIFTNPLIVAPLLGLCVNLLNIPLFYGEDMIRFFANAASALGLLTVGAAIDFDAITSSKRNLTVNSFIKLLINPLLMLGFCMMFNIDGITRDVAIVYASLPVAVSSYVMAKQFGAHGPLMSSIIITTTLVAMGSLSLTLILLNLK